MPARKKKPSAAALVKKKKTPKKDDKKLNPFEVRVNKKKHEVIGQRSKSDKGLPGVARSKAMKKRKKTLLVEFKQRNKTNQFIDRRFGEYNDELSVEEKMMQRFTLERKRKHERSGLFNLRDDNEEGLTHYGQSIGDMEKFDHIVLSDDDNVEEEDIGDSHFGGFLKKKRPRMADEETDEVERPKTRKEIMDEVVAKSKAMKYKQQSERHEMEELLDRVNSDWKNMHSTIPKAGEDEGTRHRSRDDYDRTVRELAFEKRGIPTDRLKTDEEAAKEEKERLEKLETDRVRRMKGHSRVGAEDEILIESADYIHDKPRSKKKVQFTLQYKDGKIFLPHNGDKDREVEENLKPGACDESSDSAECDSEDVDAEGVNGDLESEVESESGDPGVMYSSDLDSEYSEEESNGEPDVERSKVKRSIPKGHSQQIQLIASRELPYTFSVPKSLLELQTIVADRSPGECLNVMERIHSCHHPSINSANKQKLEAFLPVLVDYCLSLGKDTSMDKLTTLNKLARPLFKLSQLNSLHTAAVFRKLLQHTRSKRLTTSNRKKYPSFTELLLFKMIGLVFPTSDYEHPVSTPTLLLMGQVLLKCQVKGLEDLLNGLFVCQTVAEYLQQSKRLLPEAVNFLTSVVGCFVKGKEGIILPPFSSKTKALLSALTGDNQLNDSCDTLPSLLCMIVDCQHRAMDEDVPYRIVCGILKQVLLSLSHLVHLYSALPSFSEVFAPVHSNLQHIVKRSWPPVIQLSLAEVSEAISSREAKSKRVLQLLKQKPKSIKFYEPKFDEVYEVSRKKARSKAVGESQKLKHKVRKEAKGAIREIRRDTAFLAKERLTETLQLDAERAAKTKKILHDLQMGQHEVKEERKKKRK